MEKIVEIFSGKVDLIVDGGKTAGVKSSTVVDLTSEEPIIIREGVITEAEIKKYLVSHKQKLV